MNGGPTETFYFDPEGRPPSFFIPPGTHHIRLGKRLRLAWDALRGGVYILVINFPDPNTKDPRSYTFAGWIVPRNDEPMELKDWREREEAEAT
jgi:hypothetical protein